MKNIDRWFILIGLLYGTFGFAFGNLGRHQRAFRAGASARPYQPDRALPRRCCSACSTAPSRLLRPDVWAAVQFALFNLGAVVCSRQHSAGAGASDGRARGGRLA